MIPGKTHGSQFKRDLFERWKDIQSLQISDRGRDDDPAKEEEYNQMMLRQNMNAFVCYRELDGYTSCLKSYGLLDKKGEEYQVNTSNKQNEVKCRKTHFAYTNCISSQENQQAVLGNAAMHKACNVRQQELLTCLREHQSEETRTNVPMCTEVYRRLIRCGLNHLWNEYWRSLTNFGEEEEYHLFEAERDDRRKQNLLELTTDKATIERISREAREEVQSGTVPSWR